MGFIATSSHSILFLQPGLNTRLTSIPSRSQTSRPIRSHWLPPSTNQRSRPPPAMNAAKCGSLARNCRIVIVRRSAVSGGPLKPSSGAAKERIGRWLYGWRD